MTEIAKPGNIPQTVTQQLIYILGDTTSYCIMRKPITDVSEKNSVTHTEKDQYKLYCSFQTRQ